MRRTGNGYTDEFVAKLVKAAEEHFDAPAEVGIFYRNGVKYHSFIVKDGHVVPGLFLERCDEDDLSDDEFINKIIFGYKKAKSLPEMKLDIELINNFDIAKENISFRVINFERNEEFLKGVPHRRLLDLAVTYCVKLPGGLSAVINSDMASAYSKSEEDLYNIAMNNVIESDPYYTIGLNQKLLEVVPDELREECEEFLAQIPEVMRVITSRDMTFGASCLLDTMTLDKMAREFYGNFYIFPSSLHEIICAPMDLMDPEDARAMISEINQTELPAEDFLSNSLYFYDFWNHEVKIVA